MSTQTMIQVFRRKRRLHAAIAAGALYPTLQTFIRPNLGMMAGWTTFGGLLGTYLLALAIVSWPLTNYRLAIQVSVYAGAGYAVVGLVNGIRMYMESAIERAWLVPIIPFAAFLWIVFVSMGFLTLVTYIRLLKWPVYGPGQCSKCGYCLFGLPSKKCPECGKPFCEV